MRHYRHTYQVSGKGYASNEHIITKSRATPDRHPKLETARDRGSRVEFIQTRMVNNYEEKDGVLSSHKRNLGDGGAVTRDIIPN